MKRLLFFIILITIFGSCTRPKKSHWKVIWSAQLYDYKGVPGDSIFNSYFYLGYYFELNDSGSAKIINHKVFGGNHEHYKLDLNQGLTSKIFKLVSNEKAFVKMRKPKEGYYSEGPTYKLEYKTDTISRYCFLKEQWANSIQNEIFKIFDSIKVSCKKIPIEPFDIKDYEDKTDIQMKKDSLSPPPVKKMIKFIPPIMQKENQ